MRAFVQKRRPRYMDVRSRAAAGGSSEFVWGPPSQECPSCGAEGIPESFDFCGVCGGVLATDEGAVEGVTPAEARG